MDRLINEWRNRKMDNSIEIYKYKKRWMHRWMHGKMEIESEIDR